jgi:Protein of unknown function (DUF4038)/Putative collagen-binding domain of a collagenase
MPNLLASDGRGLAAFVICAGVLSQTLAWHSKSGDDSAGGGLMNRMPLRLRTLGGLLPLVIACAGCPSSQAAVGGVALQARFSNAATAISRVSVAASPASVSADLQAQPGGLFTGSLHLPVGPQTLTATAWNGTQAAGTGSAAVTVLQNQVVQVSLTILDGSTPASVPDHSPVITSLVVSASTLAVGASATSTAAAFDADGDPLAYAWSASPAGCGTFADATASSTTFNAAVPGACALQITATAKGKSDSRSVSVTVQGAAAQVFPVSVAPGRRTLQDASGRPFRIQGDSPWSLISNLTAAEAETYLAQRQQQGFNSLIVNLLEHKFAINAPANRAGQFPFTSHTAGSYDFSTPDPNYFAFADSILDKTANHGMLVFLDVMYLGYNGGDEGFWTELTNATNTTSTCYGYGLFLGNRWKSRSNLVWMLSGDYTAPAGSTGEARLLYILKGLRDAGATTQLVAAHIAPVSLSSDWAAFASSLQLNGVYPGAPAGGEHALAQRAWNTTPVRPAFLIEPGYEAENFVPGDPASVRAYGWWGQLTTIGGNFYGQRDIWPFQTGTWGSGFGVNQPWQQSMATPGAVAMSLMASLLAPLPWQKLVPSGQSGMRTLVTAGGGTQGSTDWVAAAADPAGSLLLAYVPTTGTSQRAVTVDLGVMAGAARASWWNPTTGGTISAGTGLSNAGPLQLKTPGDNGSGANDWVLVVQAP